MCLQEIKADSHQVPAVLCELEGYWCYWHGAKGYSGVGLHVSQQLQPDRPVFAHPAFDYEHRIVTTDIGDVTFASVYVPNGGKDYAAKLRFLDALAAYAGDLAARGRTLVLCGDLNVARTARDVHVKERREKAIGQLPEERALIERLIGSSLVDVGRALDPDNDALFTWWPPWRNMRERNIGWRIDYVLASAALATTAHSCIVGAKVGTSDHAPIVATFG